MKRQPVTGHQNESVSQIVNLHWVNIAVGTLVTGMIWLAASSELWINSKAHGDSQRQWSSDMLNITFMVISLLWLRKDFLFLFLCLRLWLWMMVSVVSNNNLAGVLDSWKVVLWAEYLGTRPASNAASVFVFSETCLLLLPLACTPVLFQPQM